MGFWRIIRLLGGVRKRKLCFGGELMLSLQPQQHCQIDCAVDYGQSVIDLTRAKRAMDCARGGTKALTPTTTAAKFLLVGAGRIGCELPKDAFSNYRAPISYDSYP